MATLGQIVESLEAALFVGREAEMTTLRAWLSEPRQARPRIMNVTGPGGIGKTALVRAFHREVLAQGGRARLVDLAAVEPTRAGLLAAIAGPGGTDSLAQVNLAPPLMILDGLEPTGPHGAYVREELLPGLDARVKVVISGRRPLATAEARNTVWHGLVHRLALSGLSRQESRAYLARRGVTEPRVMGQILDATGGHPLALALAADMSTQLGIADFGAVAQWRLVVSSLAAQLLQEVDDAGLRHVIQACSIVRQFDEAVLGAIAGDGDVSRAFDRLCHLSVVQPAAHGLALHDDVRHIVASDLRWRNPERHRELRGRAFAHYRDRLHSLGSAEQRGWLLPDCLYLLESDFLHQWAFDRHERQGTWVDRGTRGDREDALRLFAANREALRVSTEELSCDVLERLLRYDGTDVRILRDPSGTASAFCLVVPICAESLRLIPPAARHLLRAFWDDDELAGLPARPSDSSAYLISRVFGPPVAEGAPEVAALVRDILGLYARGGTYFLSTSSPVAQAVARVLGYRCLPGAEVRPKGGGPPVEGLVLDLAGTGVRPWLDAVMDGRPPPRSFRPSEVEDELRTVLVGWRDDGMLARSPLVEMVAPGAEADVVDPAAALRRAVLDALADARRDADGADEVAYRAVELAYMHRSISNERVAERLALSRSSFYRALRRGVSGLAEALVRSQAA